MNRFTLCLLIPISIFAPAFCIELDDTKNLVQGNTWTYVFDYGYTDDVGQQINFTRLLTISIDGVELTDMSDVYHIMAVYDTGRGTYGNGWEDPLDTIFLPDTLNFECVQTVIPDTTYCANLNRPGYFSNGIFIDRLSRFWKRDMEIKDVLPDTENFPGYQLFFDRSPLAYHTLFAFSDSVGTIFSSSEFSGTFVYESERYLLVEYNGSDVFYEDAAVHAAGLLNVKERARKNVNPRLDNTLPFDVMGRQIISKSQKTPLFFSSN